MHAFSKPELTSEDVDAILFDWIEENCNQFYSVPIIHHAKRPRLRGTKIDYWETNWGRFRIPYAVFIQFLLNNCFETYFIFHIPGSVLVMLSCAILQGR